MFYRSRGDEEGIQKPHNKIVFLVQFMKNRNLPVITVHPKNYSTPNNLGVLFEATIQDEALKHSINVSC